MNYKTQDIRNIALIGHSGEGKTSLAETMLFNAKKTTRIGQIENGNTVMDFDEEEIKRKISISLSLAYAPWKNKKINIIDAPGFFDFEGEEVAALSVADAAIIVTSASGQISVGTELAIEKTEELKVPAMIFINQVDKDNNDYFKTCDTLLSAYANKLAIIQAPIVKDKKVIGYVDTIQLKAFDMSGKEIDIPGNIKDKVQGLHDEIVELAAESDEELLEKYFETQTLTNEELFKGLKNRMINDQIILVLGGSATENKCVDFLMDKIIDIAPTYTETETVKAKNEKGKEYKIKKSADSPVVLRVFKSIADPFVGQLTFFKVLSGELKGAETLYNSNAEKQEKISQMFLMTGKTQENVSTLTCGDIGAVSKLINTKTNDTLSDASIKVKVEPIAFPKANISLSITSAKQGEDEKVMAGLNKLQEEDTTFTLEKNIETNQILISGLGETQLDVLCKKLKNKYKVDAVLSIPKIAYRETITKKVEAHGRHKKQSGGHGQFGVVDIRFEPNPDGDFEFGDEIVGGAVPKQYIPAVEKGLKEAIQKGVLAGYPVVNLKATLFDGAFHDVDSSEMAFKIAASLAYKEGLAKANPVLLEPIEKFTIVVPESYMGDILGDINKRRGRILGMEGGARGKQVITAEVPSAEMFKYATDLRSLTQGRGRFGKEFVRYEQMPAASAEKVIKEAEQNE